jgi:hypothetical protein
MLILPIIHELMILIHKKFYEIIINVHQTLKSDKDKMLSEFNLFLIYFYLWNIPHPNAKASKNPNDSCMLHPIYIYKISSVIIYISYRIKYL